MFFEKWIPEKWILGDIICGVEVLFDENGTRYFYSIVKNKSNNVNLLSNGEVESIVALKEVISKKKMPVVLGLNGKGLVIKKVAAEKDFDTQNILNESFPAINQKEFYFQFHKQANCDAYLGLFRRDIVENVLDGFEKLNQKIAGIYLGYGFIADVMPIVTSVSKVYTNGAILEFENSCINKISQTQEIDQHNLNIEGISLNNSNLMSFSLAFAYFVNSNNCINVTERLEKIKNNYVQSNKFKILIYTLIIVIFGFCLINFILFNYYFSKNVELRSELAIYEERYQKVNEFVSAYSKQKEILLEMGMLNNVPFSKIADRIASSMPNEIILCDLVMGKQDIKNDNDSLIKYFPKIIEIKGICRKSKLINEWIDALRMLDFVREAELKKYAFETMNNHPNFELSIIIE